MPSTRVKGKARPKVAAEAAVAALPPDMPPAQVAPLSPEEVVEVFTRFQAREPEPKGELIAADAYTLLVAVVLSAQATDASVNKATPALFALANTPEAMVQLGEERVRELIKTIGLYRTKARNLIALSQRLVDAFDGQVPTTRDDLESLPGVGRKTANVVLNIAFGAAAIAVDTHLFRVSNRIPITVAATPLGVELGLEAAIPERFKQHAHHWLILHGRYVCKARAPSCPTCLINDLCRWPGKRVA